MKKLMMVCLMATTLLQAKAQDTTNTTHSSSPYFTSFKVDAPIIVSGVGLTGLGVYLINNKKDLTPTELAERTKDKIPFFDRGNAGYYSEKADKDSYVPFDASFTMPVILMLINKNERQHIGQVLVLYTETMAITGAAFSLTDGLVNRSRPLVYGTIASEERRMDKNSQRAFFAGHTAATAAATFFAARVFADFNPDSKAKPFVWAIAAAVPAAVGYLRYKAGMHFLSDNIVGYAIGASAGILVPKLHKIKAMQHVTLAPWIDDQNKGLSVTYRF